MVAPAFVNQDPSSVDLGPFADFPEGKFVIATFLREPKQGEVSRRTAYIRNNGLSDGVPSFTIISNRCAHLGCPVQPSGPVFDKQKKTIEPKDAPPVTIIPTQPAGFGCPCHGGQYDTEGNRTAGPPVRALDRYEFEIRNGNLVLLGTYSVSHVEGTGAAAKITQLHACRTGPARRRPREPALSVAAAATDGYDADKEEAGDAGSGRDVPGRLARGALRPRRRRQVLPLPQGPVGHRVVPHARLGDADRVPRAGDDRRDPGDVLQAGSEQRLRVDPARSRTTSRSAGSCAACTAGARASSSS